MKIIREIIIYILFWIMSMIAAFQFGIIWELKGIDSAQRRLAKLEAAQAEIAGEIESQKAILRGINKGRIPKGGP
jgi:hypothetical protein